MEMYPGVKIHEFLVVLPTTAVEMDEIEKKNSL